MKNVMLLNKGDTLLQVVISLIISNYEGLSLESNDYSILKQV